MSSSSSDYGRVRSALFHPACKRACIVSGAIGNLRRMDLLVQPLATAEFLVLDTETNGRAGDACELTEVGAVLVGGGELHDRWETLVAGAAPLSRAIQRFTQITQDMVDAAPPAELVLPDLAEQLHGRVLVAHNAAFDRRVLRQAFERADLRWPDPPTLCTVALARRFAPLARQRRLAALADALGVEVETTHRALADAETCARVFCALFGKLCAHAATIADALAALLPPRRARSPRAGRTVVAGAVKRHRPDTAGLPEEPGVYLFRNAAGQVLYVGKSVSLRTRARSHFATSAPPEGWTELAAIVDHQTTNSELGALVLEHRLIRKLRPPGNVIHKHDDPYVYLRCRFDIAYPVLEIAREPAAGRAVTIGPLRSRAAAVELKEQLDSLFGLRHCGRKLRLRPWPSAYGQMGRCLSPCLNDLDPNLYRRRLDEALGLFGGKGDGGVALLAHIDEQMRAAAAEQAYERAAWLRRRRERIATLVRTLDGALAATHARPRLVLAPHPKKAQRFDVFWIAGGRVADWCAWQEVGDLHARTVTALAGASSPGAVACLPADAVAEARIVQTWLASHDAPALDLDPVPDRDALKRFASSAGALLTGPRGQRSVLVRCPELVQAAEGLAVDEDLGKARQTREAGQLGLELGVRAQVDLFEGDAALAEQRGRVDAEVAGVGGEQDDVARHAGKYRSTRMAGRPE
ncbi:MAG: polymerase subunit epsilon [Solirubrobacteraceae bacterium]|nr:polymerase subunit epsilon [Solirubrobacteraceae bacterium]